MFFIVSKITIIYPIHLTHYSDVGAYARQLKFARDYRVRWLRLRVTSLQWVKWIGYSENVNVTLCKTVSTFQINGHLSRSVVLISYWCHAPSQCDFYGCKLPIVVCSAWIHLVHRYSRNFSFILHCESLINFASQNFVKTLLHVIIIISWSCIASYPPVDFIVVCLVLLSIECVHSKITILRVPLLQSSCVAMHLLCSGGTAIQRVLCTGTM